MLDSAMQMLKDILLVISTTFIWVFTLEYIAQVLFRAFHGLVYIIYDTFHHNILYTYNISKIHIY